MVFIYLWDTHPIKQQIINSPFLLSFAMEGKKRRFCKYPSAFKFNKKLDDATIEFFNLSNNKYIKCKDCIYKKRKACSGAYDSDKKLENSQIMKYTHYIKKNPLPREVKIEVTPKCNLSCDFCFNVNSFKRNSRELSTNQIFKIIDKIKKEGIKRIRFTGGEPFLRKDIIKIFKYAKSKKLYVKVNTNSTLIKEKDIALFETCIDEFLFPFHSVNPKDKKENHRKINLMNMVSKSKIRLSVDAVATKENIRNLEKFYEIVKNLNAFWFIERPVPNKNYLNPINNQDVGILVEKMIKLQKYYKTHITALPFCSYDPEKVKLVSAGAKFCGPFNILAVSPTGIIKPCYSINENLGDASKIKMIDAWKSEFALNIRQLRSLPDVCKKCKYVYGCLGGCRFSAKLLNGSYSSLDPLAMPEKYKEELFG